MTNRWAARSYPTPTPNRNSPQRHRVQKFRSSGVTGFRGRRDDCALVNPNPELRTPNAANPANGELRTPNSKPLPTRGCRPEFAVFIIKFSQEQLGYSVEGGKHVHAHFCHRLKTLHPSLPVV